jgi:Holliday junction resolvase RusA-like endonuclease
MFYRQAFKTPLLGPVSVTMNFYAKNPRFDLDNIIKSCLDSGNGIAWKDDKQVKEIHAKLINDPDERTEIEILPC